MYDTMRRVGVRSFLLRESASLVVALVIAETFYKLHSFTLEAVVFLATWYVLSFAGSRLSRREQEG